MGTRDQQVHERAPDVGGAPQRRRLDPEASQIGFGVRKMGLYTVKGRFRACGGEMRVDEQERPASAEVLHVTGRLDRHAFGIRPPAPFEWIVGQHVDLNAMLVFVR